MVPENGLVVGFAPATVVDEPSVIDGRSVDGYHVEHLRLTAPEPIADFLRISRFSEFMYPTEYVPLEDQAVRVYIATFGA